MFCFQDFVPSPQGASSLTRSAFRRSMSDLGRSTDKRPRDPVKPTLWKLQVLTNQFVLNSEEITTNHIKSPGFIVGLLIRNNPKDSYSHLLYFRYEDSNRQEML